MRVHKSSAGSNPLPGCFGSDFPWDSPSKKMATWPHAKTGFEDFYLHGFSDMP